MKTSFEQIFFAGLILAAVQAVAALPWLYALNRRNFAKLIKDPAIVGPVLGAVVALAGALAWLISDNRVEAKLIKFGRFYGSVLHVQLALDLLILLPQALLLVSPKVGAVALAAFREGWRQPMFWLIAGLTSLFLVTSMVIPYYTFGEDYKMMKQLGFDFVMLAAAAFGLLTCSISINEEIEGRTAITVMSKPINRRQFILGKYFGTLLACGAMTLILGWVLTWCLYIKPYFDPLDDVQSIDQSISKGENYDRKAVDMMPMEVVLLLTPKFEKVIPTPEGASFARGVALWFGETAAHHVGFLLSFGQVMVLLSICTALATRMKFVINLVICLFVFFIGHLAPILVSVTSNLSTEEGVSALKLVSFVAQLFNTIFPALEYFDMAPAIVRGSELPMLDFSIYVGSVFIYAVLYSAIGLILALILFEDRDLA